MNEPTDAQLAELLCVKLLGWAFTPSGDTLTAYGEHKALPESWLDNDGKHRWEIPPLNEILITECIKKMTDKEVTFVLYKTQQPTNTTTAFDWLRSTPRQQALAIAKVKGWV